MVTHSSILAGKIPWIEEHGRLQAMRPQRVRLDLMTEQAHMLHSWALLFIHSIYKTLHMLRQPSTPFLLMEFLFDVELGRTLWGSWAQKPFSIPFSEFQRAGSRSC